MKPAFECCEWNPAISAPSCGGEAPGDCDRGATVNVGTRNSFHLCATCAALPRFARMKKEPLVGRLEQRASAGGRR